jgi:aspartate/methionine/tyrosine aminotransferase
MDLSAAPVNGGESMFPAPFALERFFARHEFSARYLLSASDCQGPAMADLVAGADADLRTRWEELRLGYTESQGLPELRTEIAASYQRVSPEHVLVAAPEELIFLGMHALLSPGDHVVCTFPGYQSLYELARSIGCTVDLWEPVEEDPPAGSPSEAAWRFDPAGLEALLRPHTKLVVWNFPHNPTGALPPAGDFTRMVDAVSRTGAWLFSDEMYRLLEHAPRLRLPAAVDLYDKAVSLAGMSKAFGLAGLRIGWLAARDEAVVKRAQTLRDYTTICSSAPSEILALMGLRSADTILAANRARVATNTDVAARFFARHGDILRWAPPQAGTVCFPRLLGGTPAVGGPRAGTTSGRRPTPGPTADGAKEFCAEVLQQTGALLLPSSVYGYGDAHFRLGLGRDDLGAGLEALDGYLSTV